MCVCVRVSHGVPLSIVDQVGGARGDGASAQVQSKEQPPPVQLQSGVVHVVGAQQVDHTTVSMGTQRQLQHKTRHTHTQTHTHGVK